MKIRTQLKAGAWSSNHNEALRVRTAIKSGGKSLNHSEALRVRTTIKAGAGYLNHSEALRVRSTVKAGGVFMNHNEALKRQDDHEAISMRRTLLPTSRKDDRLELLVIRAGLRAGARRRGFHASGRRRI